MQSTIKIFFKCTERKTKHVLKCMNDKKSHLIQANQHGYGGHNGHDYKMIIEDDDDSCNGDMILMIEIMTLMIIRMIIMITVMNYLIVTSHKRIFALTLIHKA